MIVRLPDFCKGTCTRKRREENEYKVRNKPTHIDTLWVRTSTPIHTYHTHTTLHAEIRTQKHRESNCTLCVATIPGHIFSSEFEGGWLISRWLPGRVTGGWLVSFSLSLPPSLPLPPIQNTCIRFDRGIAFCNALACSSIQ